MTIIVGRAGDIVGGMVASANVLQEATGTKQPGKPATWSEGVTGCIGLAFLKTQMVRAGAVFSSTSCRCVALNRATR